MCHTYASGNEGPVLWLEGHRKKTGLEARKPGTWGTTQYLFTLTQVVHPLCVTTSPSTHLDRFLHRVQGSQKTMSSKAFWKAWITATTLCTYGHFTAINQMLNSGFWDLNGKISMSLEEKRYCQSLPCASPHLEHVSLMIPKCRLHPVGWLSVSPMTSWNPLRSRILSYSFLNPHHSVQGLGHYSLCSRIAWYC